VTSSFDFPAEVLTGKQRRDYFNQCLTGNDRAIVEFWLKTLGLADLSRRAYSSESGGEQRKTLIAKAMVQQPEILTLARSRASSLLPSAGMAACWCAHRASYREFIFVQEFGCSVSPQRSAIRG
jgi:ABC-type hemin transport system ATPase subunit